jgi:hypothetical protein
MGSLVSVEIPTATLKQALEYVGSIAASFGSIATAFQFLCGAAGVYLVACTIRTLWEMWLQHRNHVRLSFTIRTGNNTATVEMEGGNITIEDLQRLINNIACPHIIDGNSVIQGTGQHVRGYFFLFLCDSQTDRVAS